MKQLIHRFDNSDEGQRILEEIGLEVNWATGNGKRLSFAWVELKKEQVENQDCEYFLKKGSRIIGNLESNGELLGFKGHSNELKYLQKYQDLLHSKN